MYSSSNNKVSNSFVDGLLLHMYIRPIRWPAITFSLPLPLTLAFFSFF
jgi:hypothetical protein